MFFFYSLAFHTLTAGARQGCFSAALGECPFCAGISWQRLHRVKRRWRESDVEVKIPLLFPRSFLTSLVAGQENSHSIPVCSQQVVITFYSGPRSSQLPLPKSREELRMTFLQPRNKQDSLWIGSEWGQVLKFSLYSLFLCFLESLVTIR